MCAFSNEINSNICKFLLIYKFLQFIKRLQFGFNYSNDANNPLHRINIKRQAQYS